MKLNVETQTLKHLRKVEKISGWTVRLNLKNNELKSTSSLRTEFQIFINCFTEKCSPRTKVTLEHVDPECGRTVFASVCETRLLTRIRATLTQGEQQINLFILYIVALRSSTRLANGHSRHTAPPAALYAKLIAAVAVSSLPIMRNNRPRYLSMQCNMLLVRRAWYITLALDVFKNMDIFFKK